MEKEKLDALKEKAKTAKSGEVLDSSSEQKERGTGFSRIVKTVRKV